MRALRRIAGETLFRADEKNKSDAAVRERMNAPSIDCMLMAARLRYAIRILRQRPPSLVAVLSVQPKGIMLPWPRLLCDDMRGLAATCAACPSGDPCTDPQAWREWLLRPAAEAAVRELHFTRSILDRAAHSPTSAEPPAGRERAHRCVVCGDTFASAKALQMHSRVKHGARAPWSRMVPGSVCPCCGVDFHIRVRCLNHLGDRRRPRCADWVLQHCKPLPAEELAVLDAADTAARKAAWRQGHTTCLALRPPQQVGPRRR